MSATLDAAALRRAMHLYLDALRTHRDALDSLNVFPVPDGDTGTNLLLTQEAVVAALEPIADDAGLSTITPAISTASLMGARGNSGVILSQVLRGLCEVLSDHPADGSGTAAALMHGSDAAYRAVAKPKEGTILSVLRDGARQAAATEAADTERILAVALEAARSSLARTPELLPELRRAGVVDAGGKGIVLLLDALHAAVARVPLSEPLSAPGPVGRNAAQIEAKRWDHAFEVQYLLEASDEAIPGLEARLSDLGDSLVIVGGGGLFNVHVHTDQPDRALGVGREMGRPREPSVVNLGERVAICAGSEARAVRVTAQACGMVAVIDGEGLREMLRSLGAVVVDTTSDPMDRAILAAIEVVASNSVVVLINGYPILPSAERAASRSTKAVRIISTSSIPSELSAAAAFNPFLSMEENTKVMEDVSVACRSGAVARDERNEETAKAPGERAWIGLVDAETVSVGDRADLVAVEVTRRLTGERSEVISLVVGHDAARDRALVEQAMRDAFVGLDLQVIDGGQPGPPFVIGVE